MERATHNRLLIFVVLWFSYASTYLLRKPLGIIKTDLEFELGLSNSEMGWLDMALLMPYALVQMFGASIGDRIGPRLTLSCCLVVSGLSMMSFSRFAHSYSVMACLLFVNGASQSLAWPATSKALNAWFHADSRNTVFGIFGTSAAVGGIGGTALAIYIQTNYSWTSVYTLPSIIVTVLGVVSYLVVSLPESRDGHENNAPKLPDSSASVRELVRIPELVMVTVAIFCLKLVRYVIYMWIPLYLLHELGYSKMDAGIFSTMFEIGGVVGTTCIGVILDKFFRGRSILGCSVCIAVSGGSLLLFVLTRQWGMLINAVLLFFAGAYNCGPDNILGGSIPAEITERQLPGAASAAVGFVNGFGNIGSMIEGPLVGFVSDIFGFSGMLYMIVTLCIIGALSGFQGALIDAKRKLGYAQLLQQAP